MSPLARLFSKKWFRWGFIAVSTETERGVEVFSVGAGSGLAVMVRISGFGSGASGSRGSEGLRGGDEGGIKALLVREAWEAVKYGALM